MKILVLSPFVPNPPNQGGKIRVFNLIKYLSHKNRVTLACLSFEKVDEFGPLRDYCEKIVCIKNTNHTSWNLFAFLLGKKPFNYLRYSSSKFRLALSELALGNAFDVVLVEMPMLWQYADILANYPLALDAHNVEYELINGLQKGCQNRIKKFLYGIEVKRFKKQEEFAWDNCNHCFTVSDQERKSVVNKIGDMDKVTTVPNGVDLEKFSFRPTAKRGQRILFLGGMDWAPNLDAAQFFLKDIFPLIRKMRPNAQVDFVGKDLWRIQDLVRHENILLHDNVPEVLPWFHEADLLAVPLRMGAGTRIKILESMASGLPVVTTSKGCEGTSVIDGCHLLVADTAQKFAEKICLLIQDESLAARLTKEARKLVEEDYSWEMSAEVIHKKLNSII